jgi:hypothetical protein
MPRKLQPYRTYIFKKLVPQTDEELWWCIKGFWGVEIPRYSVCPEHDAPFDAVANAYFARSPVSIWKGSRGLGGKSHSLAILTLTEMITLGAQATVLGGSSAQSARVHEITQNAWYKNPLMEGMLLGPPTKYSTRLNNGAWLIAITASQKSARGPHPQRLRLDEIDEMDIGILRAAQGQPMDKVNLYGQLVQSQTVMSSTHQYADKTMSIMLKEAAEKGWPCFEWCFRESMGTPEHPGWLSEGMVERKRSEISERMWATEYELQEPSIEGRAVDTMKVDFAYDPQWMPKPDNKGNLPKWVNGHFEGLANEQLYFEKPERGAKYVTGVDWAKESDWTVVRTFRTDCRPWREVAFYRTNRKPWPIMIADVQKRLDQYGGLLVHDATGIGNVIDDMLDYDDVQPFVMRGRQREILFNDYIAGLEQEEIHSPRIRFAYDECRFVTNDDLYGQGHPPDSFVAGAMAWAGRDLGHEGISPISVSTPSYWRAI